MHEKKLNQTMIDMLEKKISNMLAEINRLETIAEEEYQKRTDFDAEVLKLQTKIKELTNELTAQKISNEKLNFQNKELKEQVVSIVVHEKVLSTLDLAQSEIRYKNGRMAE